MQEFENPLTFESIPDLLMAVIKVLIIIATPITVFFIILAGFWYVTARGNPENIKQASRALLYGVIGGVIIVASTSIMLIIRNLVDSF